MPNYVMNTVKFVGDEQEVQNVLKQIAENGEGPGIIDFNKIIEMPDCLNLTDGSITNVAVETVLRAIENDSHFTKATIKTVLSTIEDDSHLRSNFSLATMTNEKYERRVENSGKTKKDLLMLGLQYITNKVLYGHMTWYDWCIDNWGTKWNAREQFCDGNAISFKTAWSAPFPIINEIARRNPSIKIEHEWADEDIGNNCGRQVYKDGKRIELYLPTDNQESVEFACNVWSVDVDEYWKSIETEEDEAED